MAAAGGKQRLAKLAHQHEALAPLGRGRCLHAHTVPPVAVLHQYIDLVQCQHGRSPQFVMPPHRTTAHHQLGLGKQPVGRTRVACSGVGKRQSGNEDAPVRRAADVKLGPFNVKLLKTQPPQRTRRHGQHHALQAQGGAALRVQQGHIAQFDGGDQTATAGMQCTNAHRDAQGSLSLLFQLHAVIADTRHNPAVQSSPGSDQQHQCHQQRTQ